VASEKHPFLENDGPIAFAHRGGASDHPENTMPAFAHAVGLGFRYVETDAHLTSDGRVLAFHDDRLDRVTNGIGLIEELTWDEVSSALVDGRSPIPLLEELLTTWPDLRVNIDPKHDAVVEPLSELLRNLDAVSRVCVGSFSDRRIQRVSELLGPELCTSLGPKGVAKLRASSFGLGRRHPGGHCVQVPVSTAGVTLVDRRFIDRAHSCDLDVHVWTIDDPDEMHRLLELGVDGIMTDRPAVLREVMIERGCWS
jgi:glycerophosphoryl diester phosphodiesterase